MAEYWGYVATNAAIPDYYVDIGGNMGSFNTRTKHVATEALSGIRLKFMSAFVNLNTGDMTERTGFAGAGNVEYITDNYRKCYIEYPAGTFHSRVKFGGADVGLHLAGTIQESDTVIVNIPEGATFWIRQLLYNATHTGTTMAINFYSGTGDPDEYVAYHLNGNAAEEVPAGTTGVPAWGGDYGFRAPPCAILQVTENRSFCLLGDSIVLGSQDLTSSNDAKNIGLFSRAIATLGYGFVNMGIGNDRASYFVASHDLRATLFQHCTDVAIAYTNDLAAGDSAETLIGNIQTIQTYFPAGTRTYLSTLPPFSVTSSDWTETVPATFVANQTPNEAIKTRRIAYNQYVRLPLAGIEDYWEYADVIENGRDGGKWLYSGDTTDGTHPLPQAYERIAASGATVVGPPVVPVPAFDPTPYLITGTNKLARARFNELVNELATRINALTV